MGLAASQARLLSITARKSDCEFQSMRLSHEKIALARDMEHISDEYQDALGKTKLVYDYYGSGMQPQDVSYNLLMRPSVYNDYYPKLITDKSNRVVLDSKYAAAAIAAGIPVEGLSGTPSDAVRNKFIQALAEQNVISLQTAASVQNVIYGNTIGLGSTFSITAGTKEVTWTEVLDMLDANGCSTSAYGLTINGALNDSNSMHSEWLSNKNALLYEGSALGDDNGNSGVTNLTLRQLLMGDKEYVYALKSPKGASTPVTEMAFMQEFLVGGEASKSFLNWILENFQNIFGGTAQNDKALQYAYDQVYNLIYPNNDIINIANDILTNNPDYITGDRHDREHVYEAKHMPDGCHIGIASKSDFFNILDAAGTCVGGNQGKNAFNKNDMWQKANENIGIVYTRCGDGGNGGQYHAAAVNLNQIAKVFLTAFSEYLQGVGNTNYAYNKGSVSRARLYNPNDNDKFVIADISELNTGDQNLIAGFYDAMFNVICTHGWVKNEQISDSAYLQEQMKNGTVFISAISNDGFFYQGNYNTDNYIVEVPDQEAIAQAEAKYNSEKAKIQSKEDTLDVKMKNLDTEISSLTTEYDTTKNIINKAVEKSFKRYDA